MGQGKRWEQGKMEEIESRGEMEEKRVETGYITFRGGGGREKMGRDIKYKNPKSKIPRAK